jgi:glycosidase
MLDWYRSLIAVRKETPGLTECDTEVTASYDAGRNLLIYSHAGLLVACNLGDTIVAVPEAEDSALLLASSPSVSGTLAPDSVSVWRRSDTPGTPSADRSVPTGA